MHGANRFAFDLLLGDTGKMPAHASQRLTAKLDADGPFDQLPVIEAGTALPQALKQLPRAYSSAAGRVSSLREMGDPVSLTAAGVGRIAPLVGKQLEEFRRRDEVKNLFRELGREVKRARGLPRGKRKKVRKKVDRLRDDGQFLALVRAYLAEPRSETVTAIRERLDPWLRFDDPDIADQAALDIVIAAIERSAPRAQRDLRDAGFTNRQATIAAVEESAEDIKGHVTRELSARVDRSANEEQALAHRLGELESEVAGPKTAAHAASAGSEFDPERHLDSLEGQNREAGRRLRDIWQLSGTAGVLALVHTPERWLGSGGAEVWVAVGRLLGQGGEFEQAEGAFLKAAEVDSVDPVRQVARAASWAQVRGDESRANELIERAAGMDGGWKHPAVRIAQARKLIAQPREMLDALEGIEPANSAERAGLETLRAQGHLLLGEEAEAESAVARAFAADEKQLGAKELRGVITLMKAQDLVFEGLDFDREEVSEATQSFIGLRDALRELSRADEADHMAARAIQGFGLLEDIKGMEGAVEELLTRSVSAEVATQIARSALSAQRADLAVSALAGQPQTPLVSMLSAASEVLLGEASDPTLAARTLAAYLETTDAADSDRGLAAYALLSASLKSEQVGWNPRALEILEAEQPIPAAILEAEHLQSSGDQVGAEAALLKQGDEPVVLQRLAVLAAEQEDWPVALQRAKSLESKAPSGGNTFNYGQILREAGELKASEGKFLEVARNGSAGSGLRSSAFGKASEVAAERHDYSAGLRISQEWLDEFPHDLQGAWFKAFTLTRLARYSDALEVLRDRRLSIETLDQAQLAATVYYRAAPLTAALETITTLSEKFQREDEVLEAMVLFTAFRASREEELPAVLANRVKESFDTFPERFPNSRRIWTIKAPRTRAEFDEFAKSMLGERRSAQEEEREIESGSRPVAGLSAQIGRSVAETFLRLDALPLGYGDPALDGLERADALQALGGPAIWDPASLFVVGGLGEGTSTAIRNALPGSMVAQATLEDCDRGNTRVGGDDEEITEIGYNPELAGAQITSWSAADSERERLRAPGMLQLARSLSVAPDFDHESRDPWNELLLEDPEISLALLTVPATIALAVRQCAPVFSDDRFVRLTARRAGLSAFGTVALLDALQTRKLLTDEQRGEARKKLLRSAAWGLCPTSKELAAVGCESLRAPTLALQRAIGDRGFWLPDVMDGWRAIVALLHEIWLRDEGALQPWVECCLAAASSTFPQSPPLNRDALLIAALEIGTPSPRFPDRFIHDLTKSLRASRVPFSVRVDIPMSSFAMVLEAIHGQPGWLPVFVATLGRFPLGVQEKVIRTLIRPVGE